MIADRGRPLEFERLGGRVHLGFQLGQVFLGDVLGLVGAADGGVGLRVGRRLGLDARRMLLRIVSGVMPCFVL